MKYVLYNPLANNKRGESDARTWANAYGAGEAVFQSVIGLDYKAFFDGLTAEDEVTLCGGDGTLNYFVNEIYGYEFKMPLFYAKCGTGNDFYKDVEAYEKNGKIDLKPFIVNLPLVTVNGIKKRFINGIGYGVDGDTCLMGDKVREKDPGAETRCPRKKEHRQTDGHDAREEDRGRNQEAPPPSACRDTGAVRDACRRRHRV